MLFGLVIAWRLVSFNDSGLSLLLVSGSVAIFGVMMAVLAALKVDWLTWVLYSYLATPFFANRLIGEVWLGSPEERVAGTVAPFLLGDLVLAYVVVRQRMRLPAWLFLAAALLLIPFASIVFSSGFHVDAFFYQYGVIVRGLVIVWFTRQALMKNERKLSADALILHLGIIFGGMGLVTAAAAFVTDSRFGIPGWGTNVLANALCVVGILGVTSALKGRGAIHWVLAIGCLLGIIGSGTRFALAVFLTVLVGAFVVRFVPRAIRFVVLPILLVGAVVFGITFPGAVLGVAADLTPRAEVIGGLQIDNSVTLPELVSAVGRESSAGTRLMLWRASMEMVERHPLTGVGWGQWNWSKAQFGIDLKVLLDPHNGYLWLLAESGIVFTAIALFAAFGILFRNPLSRPYLAYCLILLLELTNSNVQKSLFAVLAGVVIGSMLSYRRQGSVTGAADVLWSSERMRVQ